MGSKFSVFLLALGLALSTQADSTFLFTPANGTVPDNDASGWQDTRNIAAISGTIANVSVTLDISGGYNGDLYAWLSHGSGLAILLNRVGISSSSAVGYATQGFGPDSQQSQFTREAKAAQDVQFYQAVPFTLNAASQLTGMWQPDGRIIDPASSSALFDDAPRSNTLNVFDDLDPNGQWTLFVADLSPGGVSTVVSWGLNITMVPEPASTTLLAFGIAVGFLRAVGRRGGRTCVSERWCSGAPPASRDQVK